jgi:hypothetical protein
MSTFERKWKIAQAWITIRFALAVIVAMSAIAIPLLELDVWSRMTLAYAVCFGSVGLWAWAVADDYRLNVFER